MLVSDFQTLKRLIITFAVTIAIFALAFTLYGLITRPNYNAMEKIASDVAELSVAKNGKFVYLSNDTVYLGDKSNEPKQIIANFAGSDIALSDEATYLTLKTENGCEIRNTGDLKAIKAADCLTQIWWINDSQYLYFEGKQDDDTDFFDESSSQLVLADVTSEDLLRDAEISPNSSLNVEKYGDRTYVSISSFTNDKSTVCEIEGTSDIFANCFVVEGQVSSLLSSDEGLLASVDVAARTDVLNLLDQQTHIPASINLQKAFLFEKTIYTLDESDPETSFFRDIQSNKNIANYQGLRAHSVLSSYLIDKKQVLLLANDGLWRADL